MPKAGEHQLTFQNHHKQFPAPFAIYADFEALTTKIEGPELDPSVSSTQRTQLHETCSYCYVLVRCDGKTETPVEYRRPDAAEHFLRAIQAEERIIKDVLANPEVMRMTPEDILNHDAVSRNDNCHICEKPFACAGDSARDHCHITGKYRGAAHNACNLKLRLNPNTTTIPVVFHNLRSYDSHLLMQAISRVEGKVSCIPNNTEKYISFSLGQLRFIDSAQFLLASLDKLVADGRNIKKAKGVKKSVVRKNIYHGQYRETLLDKKTFRHGMDVLRSERHHIFGQHLNKISLSPFDSKRWIAENGVYTLAYGHEEFVTRDAAAMDAYIDELIGGD